jgi:transposase-like protein
VHFLRNIASAVPKQHAPAVLAAAKAIFLQATPEAAHEVLHQAAELIERRFPKVAELIRAAEHEVLAYLAFPSDHWRSTSSTNAVERVNAEIDRRAKVVGIFLRLYPSARRWREHRLSCEAPARPRVTRNLSVEPSGSDSVRASPLGPRGWPSDLIAA